MQPGGAQGEQINFHVAERGVTQRSAPEIDGSVMVDETIPVGQFANITIGWRGYDLVAAR